VATATYQKVLGAFYTGEPVARWIVKWAIRSPDDTLLDPSCGGGVFLRSASKFLGDGSKTSPHVWGIDVDGEVLRAASEQLAHCKLIKSDFFSIKPGEMPRFDAVVGNPPFIRYQSFNGSNRSSALARAREAGVHLPQLSSSWAPFLVHAASFLKKGGRLAMVVPIELAHAQYAREVLKFVANKFGRIRLSIFRRKLFPDLSEDTGVLLCDQYENRCTWLSIAIFKDIEEAEKEAYLEQPVNIEAVVSGRTRLTHYLLAPKVRHLYDGVSESNQVTRLGTVADVGIGYVTGCNDFFHLSLPESRRWRIPPILLRPALLSLGGSSGALLREVDWARLRDGGAKAYLLAIPAVRTDRLPTPVREYLRFGEGLGVPERFKCRVREPWYSVPHVRVADAFLSYMSGQSPRLVGNSAGLVAPNTLHLARFDKGERAKPSIAGWYSSLTRLSCELEGHPLGGGMLKLEPSEAERVLIPLPHRRDLPHLLSDLDALIRNKDEEAALDLADRVVLRRKLGLSASECVALRGAADDMRKWRMHK
jgi:adenine-specific DNA-methyltransferase